MSEEKKNQEKSGCFDCKTCEHAFKTSTEKPCDECTVDVVAGCVVFSKWTPRKEPEGEGRAIVLDLNPNETVQAVQPKKPGAIINEEMRALEDAFRAALERFTAATGIVAPSVTYETHIEAGEDGGLIAAQYYCFQAAVNLGGEQ